MVNIRWMETRAPSPYKTSKSNVLIPSLNTSLEAAKSTFLLPLISPYRMATLDNTTHSTSSTRKGTSTCKRFKLSAIFSNSTTVTRWSTCMVLVAQSLHITVEVPIASQWMVTSSTHVSMESKRSFSAINKPLLTASYTAQQTSPKSLMKSITISNHSKSLRWIKSSRFWSSLLMVSSVTWTRPLTKSCAAPKIL